ncbi:MAG: hypothetical protein ACXVB1_07255 [Pseudobdellovibrionaceae bacterium]
MKNFKLLLLGSLLVISASAQAAVTEIERQIGISDVYVPGGFDSNSSAYVVANGVFPNSCYRWSRSEVRHVDAFHHEVKSIASVSQGMCLMVMVPFTKEISLGKFESGKHTLRFLNGDGTYLEKTMSIE